MVDVYYYVKGSEAQITLECGMKLSEKYDKEIILNNNSQKCFVGYINPKDNMEMYTSEKHICFHATLPTKYVYVAESKLYDLGILNTQALNQYYKMIIPIEQYVFGTYRNPECIITSSLLGDSLSILNRNIDVPTLIGDSEELYIEKLILGSSDENVDFQNDILYSYYTWQVSKGNATPIKTENCKTEAFIINNTGKCILLNKPKID